jgi:hypothetical protein
VALSPDGSLFAMAHGKAISVWNLKSGAYKLLTRGHSKDNLDCKCTIEDGDTLDRDKFETNSDCPVQGHRLKYVEICMHCFSKKIPVFETYPSEEYFHFFSCLLCGCTY